jgi:hypothetical protein
VTRSRLPLQLGLVSALGELAAELAAP